MGIGKIAAFILLLISAEAVAWNASTVPLVLEYKVAAGDDVPSSVVNSEEGWTVSETNLVEKGRQKDLWVRIRPQMDAGPVQVDEDFGFRLGIYQPTIDRVWYYSWRNGKPDRSLRFGDQVPLDARMIKEAWPVFPQYWDPAKEELVMLVRIDSASEPMLEFELRSGSSYDAIVVDTKMKQGAYMGILFIMMAFHLMIFYKTRSSIYCLYSIVVLSYLLLYISISGLGYLYIWEDQIWLQRNAWLFSLTLLALMLTGFLRFFLKSFFAPWWKYPVYGNMAFITLATVLVSVFETPWASFLYGAAISFGILMGTYCLVVGLRESQDVRTICLGFLASILGQVPYGLGHYGIGIPTETNAAIFMVGGVIELVMFAAAMSSHLQALHDQKERIMRSVSGLVSQNVLSQIIEDPGLIPKGVKDAHVTIMFIDIVGFSRVYESYDADYIFDELRRSFQSITTIVQEFNGTIDRSLGDGILCFFGHDLTGEKTEGHADAALGAAIAIQNQAVHRVLNSSPERAVFPFRIGINSSVVNLGNVGGDSRFDFTIIGSGVNFASRLEAACSPNKIIVSESTRAALKRKYPKDFSPINVQIKHQSDFSRAWEYNQFSDHGYVLKKVDRLFWISHRFDSDEPRYAPDPEEGFHLNSGKAEFIVRNFSLSGLSADSSQFFGRGSQLNVRIVTRNGQLEQDLRSAYLGQITIEVCWSRRMGEIYRHGFKVIGNSMRQRKKLSAMYHKHLKNSLVPKQNDSDDEAGRRDSPAAS